MECRDARELAEPFITEQLLVETTQEIVRHLDRCHPCRAEIEAQRRLRAATRSAFERAPELGMSPQFAAGLRVRIRAEAEPAARAHRWRGWLGLAAAIVVLAAAGSQWRAGEQLSALARLAVGDHQNCALEFNLTELPISLADAQQRFGGRLAMLQTVEPDETSLPAGPLRIVERHDCVFKGHRFAHLVLQYQGTAVSVLVSHDPDAARDWWPGSGSTTQTSTDGFQTASFRRSSYTVFVVSAMPEAALDAVVASMAGPVSRALSGA